MTPPSLAHYDKGPPNIKSLLAPIGAHTPFIPEISIKIFKNTYQPKLEGNPSKIDSLSPETKKNSHFKKCSPKQIAISKRRDRFFLRKTLLLYKNPIAFPVLQSSRTSTVPGVPPFSTGSEPTAPSVAPWRERCHPRGVRHPQSCTPGDGSWLRSGSLWKLT